MDGQIGAERNLDVVLETAVRAGHWAEAEEVLECRVNDRTRRWAVEEAMARAEDEPLANLLPHCTDDQLETAVETAVTRGLWPALHKLLQRDVSDSSRERAVEKAIRDADTVSLRAILPHCADGQLAMVVEVAVTRRLWPCVGRLLQRALDDAQRAWAVQQAIQHADHTSLGFILLYCTDDQLDSALTAAVDRELWACAERLLQRRKDAEGSRLPAGDTEKRDTDDNILKRLCSLNRDDKRLYLTLTEAISHERWELLDSVLRRGIFFAVTLQQQKWILLQSSKRAPENILLQMVGTFSIRNRCVPDQLLQHLIDRCLWDVVSSLVSQRPQLTDAQRSLVLDEIVENATGDCLDSVIGNCCSKDHVDSVLPRLLERHEWRTLCGLLSLATPTQARVIVTEVSKHADKPTFEYLLDKCPKDLFDYAATQAVRRGFWAVVVKFMQDSYFQLGLFDWKVQRPFGEDLKRMVVEEAMKCFRGGDRLFASIAHHCTDDQLERVLNEVVIRRLWDAAEQLVARGIKPEQQEWVLTEASKSADEIQLKRLIPYDCGSIRITPVLSNAIKRRMWTVVCRLLNGALDIEEATRRLAVQQALVHLEDHQLRSILERHCGHDQLNSALRITVKRKLWASVLVLLARQPSDSTRGWAVFQASIHAPEHNLREILSHCPDDQFDFVIKQLVSRHLWGCVLGMLEKRGVTENQEWVSEVSKHAPGYMLRRFLHFCQDNMLDFVLTQTVSRHLWNCCQIVLERNVSLAMREWAVGEASKHARDTELLPLLASCTDGQLDAVLAETVNGRKWQCVRELLGRGVPSSLRDWALQEAIEHAPDYSLQPLLPFIADTEVDSVLIKIVQKEQWESVCELLKREVTNTNRQWTVKEASKHADERQLLPLLPHCAGDTLQSVFLETMKRQMWRAVRQVLGTLDNDRKEAFNQSLDLLGCNFDLDKSVTRAMCSDEWPVVVFILQSSRVSDDTRKRVVDDVCSRYFYTCSCREDDFMSIVQHCDPAQMTSALQSAVQNNMQRAACGLVTHMGQRDDTFPVTRDRETILLIAMKIEDGRRDLVATCIQQGFTADRCQLTESSGQSISSRALLFENSCALRRAALDNDRRLVCMLYEAGVCSTRAMQRLLGNFAEWNLMSERFQDTFKSMTMLLENMASNPRTLKSLCRLAICRQLGPGCKRQDRVTQLPLPGPLRDYLLFSDITTGDHDETASTAGDSTQAGDAASAVREVEDRCVSALRDSDDYEDYYYDDEDYSYQDTYYDSSDDEYCYGWYD